MQSFHLNMNDFVNGVQESPQVGDMGDVGRAFVIEAFEHELAECNHQLIALNAGFICQYRNHIQQFLILVLFSAGIDTAG